VDYVCPWTGFTRRGTIDDVYAGFTDGDGAYYDILAVDGGVDIAIHRSDISEVA
tara:strand:- start:9 stop:170 length:162 start_codon:yes stop_codon:yes gene_type:complete